MSHVLSGCWLVVYQVHVEFNSDSDKIVLEGPPTEVKQAKESFESFTEDLVCTLHSCDVIMMS